MAETEKSVLNPQGQVTRRPEHGRKGTEWRWTSSSVFRGLWLCHLIWFFSALSVRPFSGSCDFLLNAIIWGCWRPRR